MISTTQPTDDNANTSTFITKEQTRIAVVKEEEVEQRATPRYSTEIPLTRNRFVDTNAVIACNICTYIVDGAILTACCEELLCSKCICSWLSSHSMCPVCTCEMNSASIKSPSEALQRIMSNWTVRCDYYAPALVGCQVTTTLSQLRHHVQNCPHDPSTSETPVRAAMPSSKIDDILSASPSKLRGNIGQRIAIHTVKSNTEEGFAQLKAVVGNLSYSLQLHLQPSRQTLPVRELSVEERRALARLKSECVAAWMVPVPSRLQD